MYQITREYIAKGKARSGQPLGTVKGIVSHDTGNAGSTAHGNRNYFNNQQPSASAHTFIDDKYILEIVPLNEKAWHVRYDMDKKLCGHFANDHLIGIELCWGGKIDFKKAYDMYVWYHAYLCKAYKLDPRRDIYSHKQLDPKRKTDPDNALNRFGITWQMFLNDVYQMFTKFDEIEEEDEMLKERFEPIEHKDLTSGQLNMLNRLIEIKAIAKDYKPSKNSLETMSIIDSAFKKSGFYDFAKKK